MLVVLSGCSGVGKNTVMNQLLAENKDYGLFTGCTTRTMREGECEGKPYYFLTEEQFKQKIADGEFIEYENVHGYLYGTSKKVLTQKNEQYKVVLKDVDVKGTFNLVERLKDIEKVITIFMAVETKSVLEQRLIQRGEKEIAKRLERYDLEMSYAEKYNHIICNRDLEETVQKIKEIIEKEYKKE